MCHGITGTDVAKNAADMILTIDNFATIVSAVKEGRYLRKYKEGSPFPTLSNMGDTNHICCHSSWTLAPLVAVQLLWVNLVGFSPCYIPGVEPADKDIMQRNPYPQKGMFADGLTFRIVLEGIMIGSLALLAFIVGYYHYDKPIMLKSITDQINGSPLLAAISLGW